MTKPVPVVVGLAAFAVVAAGPAAAGGQAYRFQGDHVLGTSLAMVVVTPEPASAVLAANAVAAEIGRLDAVLSGWRPDSALARLNSGAGPAPAELREVIGAAETWRSRTGGAFDARLGAGAFGTVFDLDGLAKGYVIDSAMAAARRRAPDISGLMIDIGGDLRVWGQAPADGGWAIALADPARLHDNAEPLQRLSLMNKAVAFSGPAFAISGRAMSLIFATRGSAGPPAAVPPWRWPTGPSTPTPWPPPFARWAAQACLWSTRRPVWRPW